MSRARIRDEDGFILAAGMGLLLIMMLIGLSVVKFSDVQQNQARDERTREASFQFSEGAMQNQIFQLGRAWPGAPSVAVPATCNAAATDQRCPDAAGLAAAHSGADYGTLTCPDGTTSPSWTTEVHDNGIITRAANGTVTATTADVAYYSTALVRSRLTYDANLDGKLWVRATATTKCKRQDSVALVSQNLTPLPFPRNVVTANYFTTSNNGSKVILDTKGDYALEPGDLSLRCNGRTSTGTPPNACAGYSSSKGQVAPERLTYDPSTNPAVDASQLASFKLQAQASGLYFPAGTCPNLSAVTTGGVAYAEDSGLTCKSPGGFTTAKPGVLVIAKGTIEFGGNSVFHGIIYAVNGGNIVGDVVKISGTAAIEGAVAVDGDGGVKAGSSKLNIVYDDRAFSLIKGYAGAGIVQNSWRILPRAQW